MKQTQEFDGKNIDAAVDHACAELNVSRKQLVYDVISSGSSGIFGIVGVKKARIRVTLPEKKSTSMAPGNGDTDPQSIMSIVDEAFGEETATSVPSVKKAVPSAQKTETSDKPAKKFKSTSTAKKRAARKPAPRPNRETDPPVPSKGTKIPDKDPDTPEPATAPQPEVASPAEEEFSPALQEAPQDPAPTDPPSSIPADDQEESLDRDEGYPPRYAGEEAVDVTPEAMELGRKTLLQMVNLITSDATVVAQRDEDRLLLKVEGGNSGVLIGRRGQTLEAMQFLTDKIINRFSTSRVRLKVDIEGYMETRKANLRALAGKMADKARKTGKPATINQMTAQDRRIVHLALKDDPRVRTQSMGDGYYRRLVIFPKKKGYKKRRNMKK